MIIKGVKSSHWRAFASEVKLLLLKDQNEVLWFLVDVSVCFSTWRTTTQRINMTPGPRSLNLKDASQSTWSDSCRSSGTWSRRSSWWRPDVLSQDETCYCVLWTLLLPHKHWWTFPHNTLIFLDFKHFHCGVKDGGGRWRFCGRSALFTETLSGVQMM